MYVKKLFKYSYIESTTSQDLNKMMNTDDKNKQVNMLSNSKLKNINK